jgi:hypothetical protein
MPRAPNPRPAMKNFFHPNRGRTMLGPLPVVALALGLAGHPVAAQPAAAAQSAPDRAAAGAARVLHAVPRAGELRLDGRLDDPAWHEAALADGWVQRRPTAGEAPVQRSEARILYDRDALYVGIRLYDTAPDSLVAPLARRDSELASDWIYVLIDSNDDRRTAFRFGVNPAGLRSDAVLAGDQEEGADASWDPVWEAAVSCDSLGWSAEMRIPFSQLRFSSSTQRERVWGIQFVRDVARTGEQSVWSPSPPDAGGFVSRFGRLHGLRVTEPLGLEVVPYVVGRYQHAAAGRPSPFGADAGPGGAIGLDLRYGITSDLTLSATVNPDFGQVEADPSEVNLTGGETFLSERRPFFIEGVDVFRLSLAEVPWAFNEQLFYSRRIGRAPQAVASAPPGADVPGATRILGATKLSGRSAGGWSVGLLAALTAEEHATYDAAPDDPVRVPVEPLTGYSMLRLARDFREGRSAVGIVATGTHRHLSDDLRGAMPGRAVVGGLDWRHRFAGDRFEAAGSLLASQLDGEAAAIDRVMRGPVHYQQRPDASHLAYDSTRTHVGGISGAFRIEKRASGFWRAGLGTRVVTGGFDANDLGFHPGSDFVRSFGWLGYQHFRATPHLRQWILWGTGWTAWTLGGEPIGVGAQLLGDVIHRNNSWGWMTLRHELAALSPTALRGGPALRTPAWTRMRFHTGSDPARSLSASLGGNFVWEHGTAGGQWRLQPGLQWRPSPRTGIGMEPVVEWVGHPWQYVAQARADDGSTRFVVGRMDQRTTALTARMNFAFTPEITLEFYAQPFLSVAQFGELYEVEQPRHRAFDHRFRRLELRSDGGRYVAVDPGGRHPTFSFGRPDFDLQEFTSNLVLRWEYRPGSVLFVIWSQGRTDFGPGDSRALLEQSRRLVESPSANRLLLKLSYWFGR